MCRHIKNGEPMEELGSAPRTLTADVSWMTSLDRLILARTITNDEASLMALNGITQELSGLNSTLTEISSMVSGLSGLPTSVEGLATTVQSLTSTFQALNEQQQRQNELILALLQTIQNQQPLSNNTF